MSNNGVMVAPADVSVRDARESDAAAIAAIYNHYIRATVITFEVDELGTDEIVRRVRDVTDMGLPWVVAEDSDRILGYAYAHQFRARAAYNLTVETTIYLDSTSTGRGVGTALYAHLLPRLRALGLHVAIAGIALPNEASVAVHESFGFAPAGLLRQVGRKFDQWIDVGYWQLALD